MRTITTLSLAILAGALALTPLRADPWDKKTVITINAPVQIPTTTLQPGTYTLKLLDSMSNRHIVTVWDKDGMKLVTTVLAIPNYRLQPTGKSRFTFWETPSDQPAALRAWFYPGDNFGQEFAYPKAQAKQIAMLTGQQVPTVPDDSKSTVRTEESVTQTTEEPTPTPTPETTTAVPEPAQVTASPEAEPTPEPAPEPVAAAPEAAPDPEPSPAPAPAEQEPAAPAQLPHTASNWTEIMLVGLVMSITGLTTFAARKRS